MALAITALNSMSSDLVNMQNTFSQYSTATANMAATTTANTNLTNQNSDLELKLRELNRQEDTLNKQFLDARKNIAPAGAFARMGLSSMQDWTLAAFFFSFTLFGLILTGFLAGASLYWGRVAIFGVLMTGILVAGSAMLIRILG